MIRIGIIGCGGIANGKHLPSLAQLPDVEIVAFCDIEIERAQKAQQEYGAEGAQVYLAAYRLQCGRRLTTAELRQAVSKEGGDPVLMGLIHATQEQDTTQRAQFIRQIRCTAGGTR